MKKQNLFSILTAFSAAFIFAQPASGQNAQKLYTQCDVFTQELGNTTGGCVYRLSKNGSFEIELASDHGAQPLESIELSVSGPGKGRVIAMYTEGGEDWGTFLATGRKMYGGQPKTCWQGKGKRVCIYM